MKYLISGGHLTPALALIDHILEKESDSKIIFMGRNYSSEANSQKSREQEEISQRNLKFEALQVPRFNRRLPHFILLDAFNYLFSFFRSLWIMLKHRPQVFISFGGYLAVPLAVAAWISQIPIVTHEQTLTAGQANQFIAKLAKLVAVSFKDSASYFPKQKTKVTGNPIRNQLFDPKPAPPSWIKSIPKIPIIFITGGNQGSYIINTTVAQIISSLNKKYLVIQACGRATSQINYLHELEAIKEKLPSTTRDNYYAREWITASELAWIYKNASCVVSRAGANTILELALFDVPSVIIPLPNTKGDEQLKNAKFLAAGGGATILQQKDLNPKALKTAIESSIKFQKSARNKLRKIKIEDKGTQKLYQAIQKTIGS